MIKNKDKGFILIMTLIMALVMLIVCFVCLKIFLAPYVAIQNDIIKKKEFYMADTAIEVIREQISNIFYDYVDSTRGWEKLEENDYYIECLKAKFFEDKAKIQANEDAGHYKGVNGDLLRDSEEDTNFIAKYNGNLYNTGDNFKTTLPTSSITVNNSISKPIECNDITINTWDLEDWGKWGQRPLQGVGVNFFNADIIDTNVHIEKAYIQPVLIDDVTLSTKAFSGDNVIEGVGSGSTPHFFKNSDYTPDAENKFFLPKELQKNESLDLQQSCGFEERKFIKKHIKRRDYVIVAISTYTGSNIKFTMEYYFSLISLSPKEGDHLTFWGSGKDKTAGLRIDELRPMYRLYFRKLNYRWEEN